MHKMTSMPPRANMALARRAARLMNELVSADEPTVRELLDYEVPCRRELTEKLYGADIVAKNRLSLLAVLRCVVGAHPTSFYAITYFKCASGDAIRQFMAVDAYGNSASRRLPDGARLEPKCVNVKPSLARRIVSTLNVLLDTDRDAVNELVRFRVYCKNSSIVRHPTVQVAKARPGYRVGVIGILNGICGAYPGTFRGAIAAVYGEEARLFGFAVADRMGRIIEPKDLT